LRDPLGEPRVLLCTNIYSLNDIERWHEGPELCEKHNHNMRKIILHAGRHKTGTTTLQNFLHANTDLLSQHGYIYPRYGLIRNGHHIIGAEMTRANVKNLADRAEEVLADHRAMLDQAIDDDSSVVVISSEAFQNCSPDLVREFFVDFDAAVVIYLREPTGYLISSYAQKIQASRCTDSIEEYFESIFRQHYGEFIDNWHRVFGDKLRLRVYDRRDLIRQDIVHDFMTGVLGVDEQRVDERYTRTNANPTLTQSLLAYKIAINQCDPLPKEHERLLFNKLGALAMSDQSGKIKISQDIVDRMCAMFDTSNKLIAQKFFNREHLFAPFHEDLIGEPSDIAANQFSEIRAKLVELSPELDASLPDL